MENIMNSCITEKGSFFYRKGSYLDYKEDDVCFIIICKVKNKHISYLYNNSWQAFLGKNNLEFNAASGKFYSTLVAAINHYQKGM